MNKIPIHIPDGQYVTKTQAAKLRGVSAITVQKWIEKGQLPSIPLDGMGHLISYRELMNFEPAKGGRPKHTE